MKRIRLLALPLALFALALIVNTASATPTRAMLAPMEAEFSSPQTTPPATAHFVVLTWSDTDTGVTFNVYKAAGACPAAAPSGFPATPSPFTKIASAIAPLTFTDSSSNLTAGTVWCYTTTSFIAATSTAAAQESAASNLAPATIPLLAPTVTTIIVH